LETKGTQGMERRSKEVRLTRHGRARWMTARTETRSTAPQTNSTTPDSSSAPGKDKGEGLGRIRPEKRNGTAGEGRGRRR
jgi:hypothetical protein